MTSDNLFHFVCAKCETHLSVDPAKAGAQAPCPKCGQAITAPPVTQGAVSSLEMVKKAVENKPPKVEVKPMAVTPAVVGDEPVNPRNGLTKSQEIRAEFGAVVKLIILAVLGLIAVGVAIYYNQEAFVDFLDKTF